MLHMQWLAAPPRPWTPAGGPGGTPLLASETCGGGGGRLDAVAGAKGGFVPRAPGAAGWDD
jgi:hypothetical protein